MSRRMNIAYTTFGTLFFIVLLFVRSGWKAGVIGILIALFSAGLAGWLNSPVDHP